MSLCDKILKNINQPENAEIINTIVAVVALHSEEVAKNFYQEMLQNQQAADFLTHNEVKERLTASMTGWINNAFLYRTTEEEIEEYKKYQRAVGHVHGKIGLPISLVNYGMYIIKQDILRLLIASELNHKDLGVTLILANQILDCALQIINESYEGDLVINEKDLQALKIQFSTHHLAFDCERLRTSLSDWVRDLLLNIQQDSFDEGSLLTIRQSNFGLWIVHKAQLFLSNRPELASLICLLDEMDETLHKLAQCLKNEPQKQELLKNLNVLVSQAGWVLGEIAKEIIDQDSGRDSLTHLFNRRYLNTVMRHETLSCLKNGIVFGVIMVDIDFFKSINDSYGHDNGDRVLEQLAEILTHEVRAGDFVFRLGGEEFLIVLGDVNPYVLQRAAEKIRITTENTAFKLADYKTLAVTVSAGTALHDGHPDFHRTIKLADDALYQAKQNGRNQVVAAGQSLLAYQEIAEK